MSETEDVITIGDLTVTDRYILFPRPFIKEWDLEGAYIDGKVRCKRSGDVIPFTDMKVSGRKFSIGRKMNMDHYDIESGDDVDVAISTVIRNGE